MDMTRRLINENINQLVLEMEKLYDPLYFVVGQASGLPGFTEKFTFQSHPAEQYFINSIDRYDQIQNMFIGYEDGDFYEVLSLRGPDREALQLSIGAPEESEYAILRQFSVEGREKPVRIWKFLNKTRHTIGSRQEWETDYDPRLRTWYKDAWGNKEPVKTGPYLFHNFNLPGITISQTLNGQMNGVIGADMLTDELNDFLGELGKNQGALILLFNGKEECLACPVEASIHRDLVGLPRLSESAHPAVKGYLAMEERPYLDIDRELTVRSEGEEYIIRIHPMPGFNQEYLFIGISKDQILAPIKSILRLTTLLSLIIILLSVPIILFLSSLISKPLDQLVQEARKIAEFQLDDDIEPSGFIYETHRLSEEMASMKKGLRLFSSYVPSDLVKKVITTPSEQCCIGGHCRQMTFLFTDVEDFTSITECCRVESIFEQLSDYFGGMSAVIKKQLGTVDKYIGDSLMAFWNGLKDVDNHADQACQAALELVTITNNLNESWIERGFPPFRTRIGVETGRAMVGNVGSSKRMNYTVIGNTVNHCSRLEGLNKFYQTQIIIGEGTKQSLTRPFLLRPLDSVIVKGSSTPEKIYELRGEAHKADSLEVDFTEISRMGMESYLNRNISESLNHFQSALELKEQDYHTRKMVDRCKELLHNSQIEKEDWTPHRRMYRK